MKLKNSRLEISIAEAKKMLGQQNLENAL